MAIQLTNTGLAYTINSDGGTFQSQKRAWPWQWYELPECPDLADALRWYELCRAQWYELCREINTPEFWLDDKPWSVGLGLEKAFRGQTC